MTLEQLAQDLVNAEQRQALAQERIVEIPEELLELEIGDRKNENEKAGCKW